MANMTANQSTAVAEPGPEPLRSRFVSLPGLTLLLSVIGIGIAGYLTYIHYDESALVCGAGGGCHTVQESQYATLGPIPIAMLGLGAYLTLAGLALARIFDWKAIPAEVAGALSWGMTFAALLYYAYLTYIEVAVLEAICQWCVSSAVTTVAIFATESVGLWRAYASEDDLDFE